MGTRVVSPSPSAAYSPGQRLRRHPERRRRWCRHPDDAGPSDVEDPGLASFCTVGSGGSGGLFGPSLFIGAMLGGIVGAADQALFPDIVQVPAAYVVVGMGSFLAGVANTPLAALIIVTEMSGSYHLLPAFAFLFMRHVSIYEDQMQNKFHSPAHLKDFTVDVLKNLQVGDVFDRLEDTSDAIVTNERA
ncbi:MAG: chloride channel protein [Candidatus Latescibacterota bacterium]